MTLKPYAVTLLINGVLKVIARYDTVPEQAAALRAVERTLRLTHSNVVAYAEPELPLEY